MKEIKSAHDHFRCNIITSMEKTRNKKLARSSSKCYGHMKDHVITEERMKRVERIECFHSSDE